MAGVRQSGRHPAELPLATAAVECRTSLGAVVEYRQDGNLRLARTTEEVPVIEGVVATGRASGIDLSFLPDGAAVLAVAPDLDETILAASFCPTDGHANPTKAVAAFAAAAAAARHGATIRTGTAVTGISVRGGMVEGVTTDDGVLAADVVVCVARVHTNELCGPLGLEIPIRIGHVVVVQTTPMDIGLRQVLGVANADFAGRQQVDGRLRFTAGGTTWPHALADLAQGYELVQPVAGEISSPLNRAARIIPAVAVARIQRV